MMHLLLPSLRCLNKNTIPELALIALWIAGSSLGLWAACFSGDAWASFLQPLAGIAPDLGGVFASAIFPLLLSACAVILFRSAGCYGMCLFRGLSQGFLLGVIRMVYGASAPLMTFLLTFSGLLVNGVLMYFWLRRLRLGASMFLEDVVRLLAVCAGVGAADHLVIGPFLADVINL